MSIITATRAYKIKRIRQFIARNENKLLELESKILQQQARIAMRRQRLDFIRGKYLGDLENIQDAELTEFYERITDSLDDLEEVKVPGLPSPPEKPSFREVDDSVFPA